MSVVEELHPTRAALRRREEQVAVLTGMMRVIRFYDPASAREYLAFMNACGVLSDAEARWMEAALNIAGAPRRLSLDAPLRRPGLQWEGPVIGGYDDQG